MARVCAHGFVTRLRVRVSTFSGGPVTFMLKRLPGADGFGCFQGMHLRPEGVPCQDIPCPKWEGLSVEAL